MRIPRHWAKAEADSAAADGRNLHLVAWGWSEEGQLQAQSEARIRLQRMVDRLARGAGAPERYGYGDRPMREPVLEELLPGAQGPGAAITRNGYGCEVLNTSRVMFVDIDLPETKGAGLLGRLFGGKPAPDPAAEALARVEAWLGSNPDWGFRAYRTKAGLRLLATHALFSPQSSQSIDAMNALGADPLYVRLCRAQQCFRARLTPKPWRCGTQAPANRWPFEDLRAERRFNEWQEEYARRRRGYATCAFVRALGSAQTDPEALAIARLHDERTGNGAALPLA